jgi:N-acetylglucosamine kinase-like BadF-type ATPase
VEGYIPMTDLAQSIIEQFNGRIEKITETCFTGGDPDIYCTFSELLLRHYFTGDKTAKQIVSHGFELISRIVQRADQVLGKPLKIAIHGSLADVYKNFIDKKRVTKPSEKVEQISLLADITKEFLEEHGVKHDPMTHQLTVTEII